MSLGGYGSVGASYGGGGGFGVLQLVLDGFRQLKLGAVLQLASVVLSGLALGLLLLAGGGAMYVGGIVVYMVAVILEAVSVVFFLRAAGALENTARLPSIGRFGSFLWLGGSAVGFLGLLFLLIAGLMDFPPRALVVGGVLLAIVLAPILSLSGALLYSLRVMELPRVELVEGFSAPRELRMTGLAMLAASLIGALASVPTVLFGESHRVGGGVGVFSLTLTVLYTVLWLAAMVMLFTSAAVAVAKLEEKVASQYLGGSGPGPVQGFQGPQPGQPPR